MKKIKQLTCLFFLLLAINVWSQTKEQGVNWESQFLSDKDLSTKEYKDSMIKHDLGALWAHPCNSVYGFIGENYQRIRIIIISAVKDKKYSDTYLIAGKSMVKNNICQFSGTIKIIKARIYNKMHWGVDDESRDKGIKKQGILIAEYHFSEDSAKKHSGIFQGRLYTAWYITKDGKLKYDDIEKFSDVYRNNQFVGTWRENKNVLTKVCKWGDYRVPLSGDLDIGAAEFCPADKYLQYGWQTYRDAYFNNNNEARQQEEKQWWK